MENSICSAIIPLTMKVVEAKTTKKTKKHVKKSKKRRSKKAKHSKSNKKVKLVTYSEQYDNQKNPNTNDPVIIKYRKKLLSAINRQLKTNPKTIFNMKALRKTKFYDCDGYIDLDGEQKYDWTTDKWKKGESQEVVDAGDVKSTIGKFDVVIWKGKPYYLVKVGSLGYYPVKDFTFEIEKKSW